MAIKTYVLVQTVNGVPRYVNAYVPIFGTSNYVTYTNDLSKAMIFTEDEIKLVPKEIGSPFERNKL